MTNENIKYWIALIGISIMIWMGVVNTSNIRFIINCICLILFGLLLGKKWDNKKEVDEYDK